MTQPDVRVRVQDFGPIAEAVVDLRPLTVFVGPSNTGKTYLATLIYALHRASEGFGRMPPRADLVTEHLRWMDSETVDRLNDDAREKVLKVGTQFTSGDLPEQVREEFAGMLGPVIGKLEAELERCFDVESCSELIRAEGSGGSLRVFLDVREAARSLWNVRMDVSRGSETSGEGEINDDVSASAGRNVAGGTHGSGVEATAGPGSVVRRAHGTRQVGWSVAAGTPLAGRQKRHGAEPPRNRKLARRAFDSDRFEARR